MPPAMPPRDWNIKAVKAPEALASLGNGDVWGDVNVAHIDTGVTEHPALGAWVQIDKGVNYLEPGAKPIDPLSGLNGGHGTKTCSVLCGLDTGFSGAAPQLATAPYRAVDDVLLGTKAERRNVAQAIRHAVDVNLCEVVSISLGFPSALLGHAELGGAIDYAYDNGTIVVAAGGQIVDRVCYPGKYYRTIAAGGYVGDKNGRPAEMYQDYADMNGWIDIWAPAKPIHRAVPRKGANECYGSDGDGTSYATPLVAAAAAMWLVKRGPELAAKYGANLWMRTEAFRVCLKLSAQDLSGLSDFARVKPPKKIGDIKPKGGAALNPTTGGLDIVALLAQDLPEPGKLKRQPLAAEQWA